MIVGSNMVENPGDILLLMATNEKLGSQTTCQVGNQDFLSYHTSCSKEIVIFDALGEQEGDKGFGPFTVGEGTESKDGGLLLECQEFLEQQFVTLNDQFNMHTFDLVKRERLCAPTIKTPLSFPGAISGDPSILNGAHLLSYKLNDSECDDCEGGINKLELVYMGNVPVTITCDDDKVMIVGSNMVENPGDILLLMATNEKLGSQTTCQVGNQDFLSYHTSCSKEIVIFDALGEQEGDKGFGPFTVGAETKDAQGQPVGCPDVEPWIAHPPFDSCNPCKGGVDHAVFRWDGDPLVVVVATKENPDPDEILFDSVVQLATDEEFAVWPLDGKDKLGNKIFVNGVEIHTSCSQPFGPGLVVHIGPGQQDSVTVLDSSTTLNPQAFTSSKDGGEDMCPVIRSDNQFGTFFLTAKKPKDLLVPTSKDLVVFPGPPDPTAEDHFKCYEVNSLKSEDEIVVLLQDQFFERVFEVKKIKRFCNPVDKNDEGFVPPLPDGEFPQDHLTCYEIKPLPGVCIPESPRPGEECKEDEDCCVTCEGGLNKLELVYTGNVAVTITCDDDKVMIVGSNMVENPGDILLLMATNEKLGSQTTCQVGNQDFLSYHTSCSKEIVIFDALADQEGDKGFGPFTVGAETKDAQGQALPLVECLPGSCELQPVPADLDITLFLANQFGNDLLQLEKVKELCLPSEKTLGERAPGSAPECVDDTDCPANEVCDEIPGVCCPESFTQSCGIAADCCVPGALCLDIPSLGFVCVFD